MNKTSRIHFVAISYLLLAWLTVIGGFGENHFTTRSTGKILFTPLSFISGMIFFGLLVFFVGLIFSLMWAFKPSGQLEYTKRFFTATRWAIAVMVAFYLYTGFLASQGGIDCTNDCVDGPPTPLSTILIVTALGAIFWYGLSWGQYKLMVHRSR